MSMKVIIDTDPGTDDAIALIMALNSPNFEILGLTTVGGNATLAHTTRNALRILEFMGRQDIPVYKGASRRLKGNFQYAYGFHGPAGLTARLPSPKTKAQTQPAVEYIIQTAQANANDITLVALGPLTNVAKALQAEPNLGRWLNEIVVMGGAVETPGNVTPYAEFNIYDDPDAANVVFSSGIPITLVGLDVCHNTLVRREERHWFKGNSKGEKLSIRLMTNWLRSHPEHEGFYLCDPLTIAAMLYLSLFTFKQASITVECGETERRGKTIAQYGNGNVKVALGINSEGAKDAVRSLLSTP